MYIYFKISYHFKSSPFFCLPVSVICRPPALHFFAKRRAADPDATSRAAMKRQPPRSNGFSDPVATASVAAGGSNTSGEKSCDNRAPASRRGETKELQEDQEDEGVEHEDMDKVVYYYDVATVWVRPVDLKVCVCMCYYIFLMYYF